MLPDTVLSPADTTAHAQSLGGENQNVLDHQEIDLLEVMTLLSQEKDYFEVRFGHRWADCTFDFPRYKADVYG